MSNVNESLMVYTFWSHTNPLFGCREKVEKEKKVRESLGREKDVRNKVDLGYCLI
jgi:hypothetical protein